MSVQTVLVAVDDDDTDRLDSLAEAAIDLSKPAGATVELAHAFSDVEYDEAKARLDSADKTVTPTTVARQDGLLGDLGDQLEAAGLSYNTHGCLSEGNGGGVAELADELDADFVVVGGSKRAPSGKVVFGSTAQSVIVDVPCPVTLVKGE
ncbi:universal stress protein [Halovenus sp. HT40]|uniref:universal stress protein n=1 Tax=Halovenus sp. HT40 TaxID=3126691 RepID=UPI00300ECD20